MKKLIFALLVFFNLNLLLNGTEIPFSIGEWPPYTGFKLQSYGVATEIVTEACKVEGLEPKYLFYPWNRAETNVIRGIEFGTFPYSISKERESKFYFSDPIVESVVGILKCTHTSSFNYDEINDLKGYTIGFTAGCPQSKVFEEKGIDYEETQTIEQSIKKLKLGRIDLIVDDKLVIYNAIKELFPYDYEKFEFCEKNYSDEILYRVMISKSYPDSKKLLEKFNRGLNTIKKDGTLERIYRKYGIGQKL